MPVQPEEEPELAAERSTGYFRKPKKSSIYCCETDIVLAHGFAYLS